MQGCGGDPGATGRVWVEGGGHNLGLVASKYEGDDEREEMQIRENLWKKPTQASSGTALNRRLGRGGGIFFFFPAKFSESERWHPSHAEGSSH